MAAERRRQQKIKRKAHVQTIARHLRAKLGAKKNKKRMILTDRLLPLGSLKRKCVNRLFHPWASELVGLGRVLTYKLCEQVVKRLRKFFQLGPLDDEMSEVKQLHRLIKYARKRKLGSAVIAQHSAMSSDDLMETIPMQFPEDGVQDWHCVFNF